MKFEAFTVYFYIEMKIAILKCNVFSFLTLFCDARSRFFFFTWLPLYKVFSSLWFLCTPEFEQPRTKLVFAQGSSDVAYSGIASLQRRYPFSNVFVSFLLLYSFYLPHPPTRSHSCFISDLGNLWMKSFLPFSIKTTFVNLPVFLLLSLLYDRPVSLTIIKINFSRATLHFWQPISPVHSISHFSLFIYNLYVFYCIFIDLCPKHAAPTVCQRLNRTSALTA